jgi:hypothetical protein
LRGKFHYLSCHPEEEHALAGESMPTKDLCTFCHL